MNKLFPAIILLFAINLTPPLYAMEIKHLNYQGTYNIFLSIPEEIIQEIVCWVKECRGIAQIASTNWAMRHSVLKIPFTALGISLNEMLTNDKGAFIFEIFKQSNFLNNISPEWAFTIMNKEHGPLPSRVLNFFIHSDEMKKKIDAYEQQKIMEQGKQATILSMLSVKSDFIQYDVLTKHTDNLQSELPVYLIWDDPKYFFIVLVMYGIYYCIGVCT